MPVTAQTELFSKVTFSDKLLFTKHLATMIKAGVPLAEALEALQEQNKNSALGKVIVNLLSSVRSGNSLAESLSKHPKVFDQFYINMVAVGEKSGSLADNLKFLSIQLNKDFNTRKKVRGAMLYPSIILVASLMVGGFIAFFVLPQLIEFFQTLDMALPLATRILLMIATGLRDNGLIIILIILAFFIFLSLLLKNPKVKLFWHKAQLNLPIFSKLIINAQLSRFSRNLGTLIESGTPTDEALKIVAETLSNFKFKKDLLTIESGFKKGDGLSLSMEKKGMKSFTPLVLRMVRVGEKTGSLEEVLFYLADYYDEEIDNFSKNLTTILEPMLLLFIGLVVAFIAMAIIGPIYQLTGSIQ